MRDCFDVLVVGGGVIGASIAWRLARQNARVLLLDCASVGAEASSAAAGMLAPGGEFDGPSPGLDFAVSSLARYPDYAASLEAESGCSVELRHSGAVQIATTDDELQSLAERAGRQRSSGIRSQVVFSRELRELAPRLRGDVVGGVHFPDELTVHPQRLMQALQAACLARGTFLVEGAPVVSMAAGAEAVRASLPDRAFEAAFAVIAAGAWSQAISVTIRGEPHALPRVYPIKGHLLGYRLGAGSPTVTVRHGDTYVLQRGDGFTIAGSSMEDVAYDKSVNAEIVRDLQVRAGALLPALAGLEPEKIWTGLRPATGDQTPHIGRFASSRIWLAYGHHRNGILLAPGTCERVAQEIGLAMKEI
jgi:glycine oxidase